MSLTFCGAARNVTGSRTLVETAKTRFLVDCGMHQERDFLSRNWEPFRIPPRELKAVLLTHAHLDHCGLLPKLVAEGFRGDIVCTPATAEVAKIILQDSAKLQEEDAAYKKKRHMKEGRRGPHPEIPLYTGADVEKTLPLFKTVEYGETVVVAQGVTATYYDAGHVLGSAMIRVVVTEGTEERRIVFSGDIGRWDRPMLEDPHTFLNPDYVVMESTYGDRNHDENRDIKEELTSIVNSAVAAGGHIIVPSFALQRSQEMLYYLNELLLAKRIPPIPAYLDSPMAIRITEVFKRHERLFDTEMREFLKNGRSPFDFPGLRMVQTTSESKQLNYLKGTAMIIAGSGMVTGGRIKHHLSNNISRPEATILFIGYQAVGTLGRHIVDGAKSVRIFGTNHAVRARIARIHGFSAHADRDDLIRWLSSITKNPRRIFVNHGEESASREFARLLGEEKGLSVLVPHYGQTVPLD
ncbi:MAG: MBL fold metallo-hydrolase [Acidobacteria bacterium]|nr:MBL fold metallo-hydrolase [Acidobacteriota bacterium]